jgi:hypothetical protein
MGSKTKVGWLETITWDDSREVFFVEAEKDEGDDWRFSDRSSLEVCWYARPSTPELVERAQLELQRRNAANGGHRHNQALEHRHETTAFVEICPTHT